MYTIKTLNSVAGGNPVQINDLTDMSEALNLEASETSDWTTYTDSTKTATHNFNILQGFERITPTSTTLTRGFVNHEGQIYGRQNDVGLTLNRYLFVSEADIDERTSSAGQVYDAYHAYYYFESLTPTSTDPNAILIGQLTEDNINIWKQKIIGLTNARGGNSILGSNVVSTSNIIDGAITNTKLGADSVTNDKVANNAIKTENILDRTILGADIALATIGIENLNFDPAQQIADGVVTTPKIANGAVTLAKMASNSVGASQIINDSVGTAEIASDAITTNELADNAVEQANIKDNNVNPEKLSFDKDIGAVSNLITPVMTSAYWSGNVSVIGQDNVMYEMVCAFDKTSGSEYPVVKTGTQDWNDTTNTVILDNGNLGNTINSIIFPSKILAVNYDIYPYNKPIHVVWGREGLQCYAIVNGGERINDTLDGIMPLSNAILISNSSNTVLLRKFSVPDDALAQRLYNNGDWANYEMTTADRTTLQDEFLGKNIDKTTVGVWDNSAGGSNLTATNYNQMTINWGSDKIPQLIEDISVLDNDSSSTNVRIDHTLEYDYIVDSDASLEALDDLAGIESVLIKKGHWVSTIQNIEFNPNILLIQGEPGATIEIISAKVTAVYPRKTVIRDLNIIITADPSVAALLDFRTVENCNMSIKSPIGFPIDFIAYADNVIGCVLEGSGSIVHSHNIDRCEVGFQITNSANVTNTVATAAITTCTGVFRCVSANYMNSSYSNNNTLDDCANTLVGGFNKTTP